MKRVLPATAVCSWCAGVAIIGLVGFAVALGGADGAARQALNFDFPRRQDTGDLARVFAHNMAMAGVALVAASTRKRPAARMLLAAWSLNLVLVGVAVGAYGAQLLRHAGLYGALELAAFSVIFAACRRLLRSGRRPRGGELFAASALLLMAATAETVLGWRP